MPQHPPVERLDPEADVVEPERAQPPDAVEGGVRREHFDCTFPLDVEALENRPELIEAQRRRAAAHVEGGEPACVRAVQPKLLAQGVEV